jgi:2-(1,2-epoxy-1,2-dihydrophenyl)acetyl-CoA isomerase
MELNGLRLRCEGGLAQLTFTEGDRGNPIDGPLCASLCEASILISDNPFVRCLLIDAEGKAFSHGGDVSAFAADLEQLTSNIKRWTTTLHSPISRLQRMDAPIVAAVHGVCAGGMSAFIAGSDLVIAAWRWPGGLPRAQPKPLVKCGGYCCRLQINRWRRSWSSKRKH